MKIGTACSRSSFMRLSRRSASAESQRASRKPSALPRSAKATAVPISVNATGKPVVNSTTSVATSPARSASGGAPGSCPGARRIPNDDGDGLRDDRSSLQAHRGGEREEQRLEHEESGRCSLGESLDELHRLDHGGHGVSRNEG